MIVLLEIIERQRTTTGTLLVVMKRIVKLLELVSNPFVYVYTIKYVQFKVIKSFKTLKTINHKHIDLRLLILNLRQYKKYAEN